MKKETEKLKLPQVIEKITKKEMTFTELPDSQKVKVLKEIKKSKRNVKFFGEKWYDCLSKKFFASEYMLNENDQNGYEKEVKEFESFASYFEYLDGDIYENACYYGYMFSEDEINKYKLNIDKMNFDAFIDDTLDLYTFDHVKSLDEYDFEDEEIEYDGNPINIDEILEWTFNHDIIQTSEDLKWAIKDFEKTFNCRDATNVFIFFLIKNQFETIKEPLIDYICKYGEKSGASFGAIYFLYGKETAYQAIKYSKELHLERRQKDRIKKCKELFDALENGEVKIRRDIRYNAKLQLYEIYELYYLFNTPVTYINRYFRTLNEFACFLSFDLSGADLSHAPIKENDVETYKIDNKTKLPFKIQSLTYEVIKKYEKQIFIVIQRWRDSQQKEILAHKHFFERFFDFVHFLRNDLTNADLIMCDGIENIATIPNLKLENVLVRSIASDKLKIKMIPFKGTEAVDFDLTSKYEMEIVNNSLRKRTDEEDSKNVSYISDIHLNHRIKEYDCKTITDVEYVLRLVVNKIIDDATDINLIGGDVSSDLNIFKRFITLLSEKNERGNDYFFVLGNHELWPFANKKINDVITFYRNLFDEEDFEKLHLVHNNLFYNVEDTWKEVTEEELFNISNEDLKKKMRDAQLIIFGGIGFAGKNEIFNANNLINGENIDFLREDEIKESEKFLKLYEKVTTVLEENNLIVLTHMPISDWGGELHTKNGVVYVNGHTHKNYYCDDGAKRIFADNQIGYKCKNIQLKKIPVEFGYDWFADYQNGIHEITREDYLKFYRGIGETITFWREYDKLYLIKNNNTYMFVLQNHKKEFLILNGGSTKKLSKHSLDYFYDNLEKYSESIHQYLAGYSSFQKQVSSMIKQIGGTGEIHGAIVDIDFYNHLYINPLDRTITPYFANSIVDKYVYSNVPSLLKYECPSNYEKFIALQNTENPLIPFDSHQKLSKRTEHVESTEMYRVSRILKGFQYTTNKNVIRIWNDDLVDKVSEENGREILSNLMLLNETVKKE